MMNTEISDVLTKQRQFFQTGSSLSFDFRQQKLKLLYQNIQKYESEITQALRADLGKAPFEAFATEIGMALSEISHTLKHLKGWMKRQKVPTPFMHFPSRSFILHEPFGLTLIISPWNYPFQLVILPLIGAIAAGNCAIIKPSEYAEQTAHVLQKIIAETFDPAHVTMILGDADIATKLLQEKFDYIFFTGSTNVGRKVMQAAAQHLTPLTLELGGKSPCIVDESADVALAAKRIMWGKLINAGQTCVAPDYILVHSNIKDKLLSEMQQVIRMMYGPDMLTNPEYPKIINAKHYERLRALMQSGGIVAGGRADKTTRKIEPTIIEHVDWDSPLMQEEIFGPLLPIMTFEDISEVINLLKGLPKPLALYHFTTNKQHEQKILNQISFGGGCINDTLIHFSNTNLPVGGVGLSGLGNYHGKTSFTTFSHAKSIMKKSNALDIPVRYPPFKNKLTLLKKFMR